MKVEERKDLDLDSRRYELRMMNFMYDRYSDIFCKERHYMRSEKSNTFASQVCIQPKKVLYSVYHVNNTTVAISHSPKKNYISLITTLAIPLLTLPAFILPLFLPQQFPLCIGHLA